MPEMDPVGGFLPKHWRIDAVSYVLLHAMHILDVDDIHDAELPESWQYHIDTGARDGERGMGACPRAADGGRG